MLPSTRTIVSEAVMTDTSPPMDEPMTIRTRMPICGCPCSQKGNHRAGMQFPKSLLNSEKCDELRPGAQAQQRKTPVPGALGRGFILSVRHACKAASLARLGQQGGNPPLTAMPEEL